VKCCACSKMEWALSTRSNCATIKRHQRAKRVITAGTDRPVDKVEFYHLFLATDFFSYFFKKVTSLDVTLLHIGPTLRCLLHNGQTAMWPLLHIGPTKHYFSYLPLMVTWLRIWNSSVCCLFAWVTSFSDSVRCQWRDSKIWVTSFNREGRVWSLDCPRSMTLVPRLLRRFQGPPPGFVFHLLSPLFVLFVF
jgi:hypothetical protein